MAKASVLPEKFGYKRKVLWCIDQHLYDERMGELVFNITKQILVEI